MRISLLMIAIFTVSPFLAPEFAIAQQGQAKSVAQTQPSDPDRPVASVNPTQPLQIRVINQADSDVAVTSQLIQPASNEREVAPGSSVIFGRLHTSYLPLPLQLMLYVKSADIGLKSDVRVVNNEMIVTVMAKPAASPAVPGAQTVNVDATGNVYLNLN